MVVEVKKVTGLIPVKIAKVCSNDEWPLVYIPKVAVEKLGLRKGRPVVILLDNQNKTLVVKPLSETMAQ
jgi:hypothetical protein